MIVHVTLKCFYMDDPSQQDCYDFENLHQYLSMGQC